MDQEDSDTKPAHGVTIQPEFALGRFRRQLQIISYAWRNHLHCVEQGLFWVNGAQRVAAAPVLELGEPRPTDEEIVQVANTDVLLGATRALIDYMDILIGLMEMREGIWLERDIAGDDDLLEYLDEVISNKARDVGARTSLKNPQKIVDLGLTDSDTGRAISSLFDIRQALEHHKRIATRRDLTLEFYRLRVSVEGGEEFLGAPMSVKAGERLVAEFVKETRKFNRGEPVVFSERDIELILQTLAVRIGPSVLDSTLQRFQSTE